MTNPSFHGTIHSVSTSWPWACPSRPFLRKGSRTIPGIMKVPMAARRRLLAPFFCDARRARMRGPPGRRISLRLISSSIHADARRARMRGPPGRRISLRLIFSSIHADARRARMRGPPGRRISLRLISSSIHADARRARMRGPPGRRISHRLISSSAFPGAFGSPVSADGGHGDDRQEGQSFPVSPCGFG